MAQRTLAGSVYHAMNACLATFGLSVSKIPERFTLERHIQTLTKQFGIDCIVDVGAHWGEFGTMMRSLGYAGRIISFEPTEESWGKLGERRAGDKAWDAHRMALGSANESLEMVICGHTEFNSLHAPSEFGVKDELFGRFMQATKTERVEVKRLDSVLPELIPDLDRANIFLKCDTQGHDTEVFAGAAGILSRVKMLQVELASTQLYEGVPTMEEALQAFRKAGFFPTGFFPVSHEKDEVTVVEWDCVLARRNAA